MIEDSAVIERCLSGEADSFRTLVERYEPAAVSHALAIVAHREDALEAVQDAFVDAWRALKRFDATRKFYPWFYVILRHRCFKLLEHRRRRPETSNLDTSHVEFVQSATAHEQMADLHDTLMKLSAEDREIILLKHVDGLTCDELAERLEIPPGTVMSRLYHARCRLRKLLGPDRGNR